MTININDTVRVKLTDVGRGLYRGRARHLGLPWPEEDADGRSEWQLHELMAAFGPHLIPGAEPPFEMTIQIVTKQPVDAARTP